MKDRDPEVIALGEILIDFTRAGETGQGQTLFAQNPGGAPANVAVAVRRLGVPSAFWGKVGEDMHGAFLRRTLEREAVDTAGLVSDPDVFTTLAFVDVDPSGEREFSFARKPGADTRIRPEELPWEQLDTAKILHIGSLSLTEEPARSTTWEAVERARDCGVLLSYDPNYRASLWNSEADAVEQMRSLVPYVDLMKLSDEETVLLTDEEDPQAAARILHDQGVSVVAVTLGADGTYLSTPKEECRIPGFPAEVVDATGAGDAFFGGFLSELCQTETPFDELTMAELADFARFGNAVASLCVERPGAIPALPTRPEVLTRLS